MQPCQARCVHHASLRLWGLVPPLGFQLGLCSHHKRRTSALRTESGTAWVFVSPGTESGGQGRGSERTVCGCFLHSLMHSEGLPMNPQEVVVLGDAHRVGETQAIDGETTVHTASRGWQLLGNGLSSAASVRSPVAREGKGSHWPWDSAPRALGSAVAGKIAWRQAQPQSCCPWN